MWAARGEGCVEIKDTLSSNNIFIAAFSPPQEFDSADKLEEKVALLSEMISAAQHMVVHTGAGISTSAGRDMYLRMTTACMLRMHPHW